MNGSLPYLALALTGEQVIALIGDPRARARWDATPLAFTVLGVDRVAGTRTGPTLEPTVAATFLTASTDRARVLAPAGLRRDHPYNLARRSASAGLLSGGRTGLVFGSAEPYAPSGGHPWTTTLDTAAVGDGITAERALERSWPYDAVVADVDTAVFVQSDRIVRVDAVGAYPIAGPLTIPEPEHGAAVSAWYSDDPAPSPDIDLVIGARGDAVPIDVSARLPDATGAVLADHAASIVDLLDAADRLHASGARPIGPGPLRRVLRRGLPDRVGAPAAFGAPVPGARL